MFFLEQLYVRLSLSNFRMIHMNEGQNMLVCKDSGHIKISRYHVPNPNYESNTKSGLWTLL